MLTISIPDRELFNEEDNSFYQVKGRTLVLEHSLVSLAKWESKWKKPFLTKNPMTSAETIDYIRFMTITQNVPPEVYITLPRDVINKIYAYIEHPMTATTFRKDNSKLTNREVITAEIIYYWMIVLNIPMECQKWHLNRLLTLINVVNIKTQPTKKLSRKQLLSRNRRLNAERRRLLNTTG